jgi:hypothetical protein
MAEGFGCYIIVKIIFPAIVANIGGDALDDDNRIASL